MNSIIGAEKTVLLLDTQSKAPANGADFQPGEHISDTPRMASASKDGACPRPHAPSSSSDPFAKLNAYPRGRWTTPPLLGVPPNSSADLAEAPLEALFGTPPETSMVEEGNSTL
jgi:hypothetical protein